MKEERIKIGKVVAPVGIKGEVKIYSYSNSKEHYESLKEIMLEDEMFKIEKIRFSKNLPIIKFNIIQDRNAAELLRGKEVYMYKADLLKLPEGTYYVRDLIGSKVYDQENELIGELIEVIQNGAQDLYEVKIKEGRKMLIPVVREFIKNVDVKAKEIVVKIPDGLTEL